MAHVPEVDPEFHTLAERSKRILKAFEELKSDPASADWRELKKLADEARQIADQMEALLPPSV